MELHQLRCAVAVVDCGGFTKAAKALYMSQPTLSYAIAKLEAELGVTLFDRLPRRIDLTAAGEAFIGPARETLEAAERTRSAAISAKAMVSGPIGLAVPVQLFARIADCVRDFHEQHPRVRVNVMQPDGDAVPAVRNGHVELAVTLLGIGPHPGIEATLIGWEEAVALVPAGTGPTGTTISMSQFLSYPLVAPPAGTGARVLHDRIFTELGLKPTVAAESAEDEGRLQLARAGLGALTMTRFRLDQLASDGLDVYTFDPPSGYDLGLIHRPGPLSPAASAFRAAVLAHFAEFCETAD